MVVSRNNSNACIYINTDISYYLVILYELICKGLRYKYISQIAYQNALLVFWKSPRMHQIVGTLFCRTLHEGLRT